MVRKILVRPMTKLALACGALLLCAAMSANAQTTINVSSAAQLQSAVQTANGAGGNRIISVADGTYTLSDTLYVNAPNVSIVGASGNRQNVVIQGTGMSASASVGTIIRVAASGFQLRYVTLQKSKFHLIQVVGENNADSPSIRDCILRDAYEQMIKASIGSDPNVTSDNGLVENCLFEYTAGIGPQYYIGGIDAHGSKNWVVRGNTFRNIASPSNSVAEFAVHFWDHSANNTVEKNVIVNCDRGIGFGLQNSPNTGGIIRNNMIYHAANNHPFADSAIALAESADTRVYNNTIYNDNSYPWAIEYRFSSTTGASIVNNLTNRAVQARDGASGTVTKNVTNAAASWFADRASGDLHLASSQASVVDVGQAVSGLTDDFDGQARPQGGGIDIGADEYGASTVIRPNPPTNVSAQ
jgi:parallel beta helix pectate lyase-like protein